jgi:hypothetical protein
MSEYDTYALTLPIEPEESLNGYFQRVSAELCLRGPSAVLSVIDVDVSTLQEFHRTGAGIDVIAKQLAVSSDQLNRRRYAPEEGFSNLVRFAGNVIDRSVFAGGSPRVAPHAFKATGIHRMSWDLAFVVADPETGERLIGACPNCQTAFTWQKSNFLNCHSCGEAIATGQAEHVDEDLRVAIAGLADLVCLDRERADNAMEALPPDIRKLSIQKIYKFIFSLAGGLEQEADARRPKDALDRLGDLKKKPGRRTNDLDWSSAVLRAYKTATGWPDALLGYLKEEQENSDEREGKYGTKKAFGYFQILLREWSAEAEIWSVVVPAIQQFLEEHPEISLKSGTPLAQAVGDVSDGIMLKDVKAKYGWSHRRITKLLKFPGVLLSDPQGRGTPLRISRRRIEEIMNEIKGMVSARYLRGEWRLRHVVIADLCSAGVFGAADPEYLKLVGTVDALYRKEDVAEVFRRLEESVKPERISKTTVTAHVIVHILQGKVQNPWTTVVKATLAGELTPIKFDASAHNFFDRLLYDRERAHQWAYQLIGVSNPTVSLEEVGVKLCVNANVVAALIKDNQLSICRDLHGGRAHRVHLSDLNEFDKTYISQNKLRKQWEAKSRGTKIPPDVFSASCKYFGLEPLPLRGMPMRFFRKQDFPKEFRILSRKELGEAGVLRNGIRIGNNAPGRGFSHDRVPKTEG